MNGRVAGSAAIGGVIAILVYCVGGVILFFAVVSSINPIMGAASELSPAAEVAIFVVIPAVFFMGGVFPARALGAGWVRSVVSPGVVVGVCCLLVTVIGQDTEHEFLGQSFDDVSVIMFLFLTPPVLTMLLASIGPGRRFIGALAVLGVGTIQASLTVLITLSAGGLGLLVGLLAWVSVPAVAGLFQPRSEEPGD